MTTLPLLSRDELLIKNFSAAPPDTLNPFIVDWWMPHYYMHIIPYLPEDFPRTSEFWICFPLAILITLLRSVVNHFVSPFLIRRLKLTKDSLAERNAKLNQNDKAYIPTWILKELADYAQDVALLKKRLKKQKIFGASQKVELQNSYAQFEARIKASPNNTTPLTSAQLFTYYTASKSDCSRSLLLIKYREACWRTFCYTFIFGYGLYVAYVEDWLWDMYALFGGWPLQPCSKWLRFYYFISLAHYIHLFVAQFFDIKRKDWWEMFIHHVVTMLLLYFSFLAHFVRVGVIVLLCHDFSDILLECAKIFNYLKYKTLCDVTFVLFAIAFFLGRLVLFPYRVIYVIIVIATDQLAIWRPFYIFLCLLLTLQVLHIFWFYTIVRMIIKFLSAGEVKKDERSDTDDEEEVVPPPGPQQQQMVDSQSTSADDDEQSPAASDNKPVKRAVKTRSKKDS